MFVSATSGYENGPKGPAMAIPGDLFPAVPQAELSKRILIAMQAAIQGIVSAGRFPAEPNITVAVPSYSHPSLPPNPSDVYGRFSIEPAVALHNVSGLLIKQDGLCNYQTDPRYQDPSLFGSIANEISARVHSPASSRVVQQEAKKVYRSPERRLVVATSMARLGVAVMHKHGANDFRNMLEQDTLQDRDFPESQETPRELWQAFTADLEALGIISLPDRESEPSTAVKRTFFSRLAARAIGR